MSNILRLQQVIKSVVTTEKSAQKREENVLTLIVDKSTNKVELTQAVKAMFNIDVVSINILNVKGKTKNRGLRKGRRSDVKKAYVTYPAGSADVSEVDAVMEN